MTSARPEVSVTIPEFKIEAHTSFVFVFVVNGTESTVSHRFSECKEFHQTVAARFPYASTNFPPNRPESCNQDKPYLEKRRGLLERWIQPLVACREACEMPEFLAFAGLSEMPPSAKPLAVLPKVDNPATTRVCVTGCTGYIAGHIVQQLLQAGFLVRGTCRSLKDEKKLACLRSLEGADRLELVEADLLAIGSFDAAVEGCDFVMHTASPFMINGIKDPQKELIDPALEGTKNVFAAVNKAPSVKRVIVTSSVAAVSGAPGERGVGYVFSESDWNLSSNLKDGAYSYSKRLAEEAAWDITKAQSRYDMVTINPGFVFGPSLSGRADGASVDHFVQFFNGKLKMGVPNLYIGYVDVRDVAKAHILAMTKPEANGRHICVCQSATMLDIGNILAPHYPKSPLPKGELPKPLLYLVGPIVAGLSWHFISNNIGVPLNFNNTKIKTELGIDFIPLEKTVLDFAQSLLEHGLITVPA